MRKRQRRRRNGRAAALFAMAFIVAIFGTGGVLGVAWLDSRMHPPDYSGGGGGNVTVQIKDGDGGYVIAAALEQHDVVKSSRAFIKVYGKETKAGSIQPGFYRMRLKMSSSSAMALLLDTKSRADNQITIFEGLRTSEIFDKLSKKTGIPLRNFQAAEAKPQGLGLPAYAKGLEGYLFPGRYDLNPNGSAREILKQMVDRFNQEAEKIDLEGKAKQGNMRPAELITMASLIQSEGGKPGDLAKISRVIRNRMEQGIPLQFDSSVLYALKKRTLNVRNHDTQYPSPYNTYLHKGLPPGPISSPGADSIEAAASPKNGTWLYFIAVDPTNKRTEFTADYQEFLRLKKQFNRWQQQNPGN
ncbi:MULTISPECIES: endolytic transglycosylase MltG [Thermomonosporaceae]|uniref:endolytic transglycosylase MltG n=1 Tax=Thermomonosporaceae TaxID=2012 RepID=UPI00255B1BAE|nr:MULTISPECIES: endolytic transglycosylase MltG [Thermomonosporaceae]MDL4777265.1 endolytic transglycosylase MltG [Actinomadura xylanilytica]